MKAKLTEGLTTVHIDTGKETYKISHAGTMGNTLEDVDKNLLRMGFPTLEDYREHNEVVETGSPDYLYEMKVII